MSMHYVPSESLIFFRFVWGLLLPKNAVSLINFQPQPSPSKKFFKENKMFKVSDFIYDKYALFTRNSWRKKKTYRISIIHLQNYLYTIHISPSLPQIISMICFISMICLTLVYMPALFLFMHVWTYVFAYVESFRSGCQQDESVRNIVYNDWSPYYSNIWRKFLYSQIKHLPEDRERNVKL